MTDDKSKKESGADRGALAVTGPDLLAVTGATDENLDIVLLTQAALSFIGPGDTTEALALARAALEGLAPRDELEGMLAVQMVAAHSAAMECLRRAKQEEQSSDEREQNLKHAAKLLAVYMRQVDALDKHRGKDLQNITVERVTVNSGGRAIVGHVEAGAGGAGATGGATSSADRPPLTPSSSPPEPEPEPEKRRLARPQ